MSFMNSFLASGGEEGFIGHCSGFIGGPGFFSGHFMGGIFMVLFWVLVISGIIWLVKSILVDNQNNSAGNEKNRSSSSINPEELARKRFARGEISRDEYEEIVTALEEY